MPHPNRMIPDRELNNFRIFLKANPHLTQSGPEGAFDAKPSGKKNIRFNKEKRFTVALSDFGRGGAFDAAAEEMETKPQSGLTYAGLKQLARKMSPEGWATLHEVLNEGSETEGAEDEPPDFPGKPIPGGKMVPVKEAADNVDEDYYLQEYGTRRAPAMDSAAAKSFAERYPDIAAVKVNSIGQQPRPERSRLTAKGAASFNAMFPEAARIKVR